jgi:ParB family chromosome partitioning protein
MGDLRRVQISQIRENPVALRTVQRQSEEYLGLVASMREKGFMGAITVRERQDPESKESFFELIDGLHRFSAAKDAGISEIGVDVVPLTEDQVLEAQILANIHKVETRPAEYTQQLKRILARNPLMTEAELAKRLGKSPQWISQRLSLTKIDNPQILELINSGQICLSNAYALAKLPAEEMANFVERGVTLPPDEFIPLVNNRAKEIKDAKRQGQDAAPPEFIPVAHLRKLKEIKTELEAPEVGPALVKATKVKTAVEGFNLAIAWMLHLDPVSLDVQKTDFEARERQKKEDAAKRAADRERKKAETAEKKAEFARKAAANAEAQLRGEPLPHPELKAEKTDETKAA